jgi:hypothetical protein
VRKMCAWNQYTFNNFQGEEKKHVKDIDSDNWCDDLRG